MNERDLHTTGSGVNPSAFDQLCRPERCACRTVFECFRIVGGGVEQWGTQCAQCGRWAPRKKDTFSARPTRQYDEALAEAWRAQQNEAWAAVSEARIAQLARERIEEKRVWLREHDIYLATPKWRALRDKVLERDGHVCQGCLSAKAFIVHHLTYAHWRDELLFELTSLCDPCHAKAHRERAR